MSSSLSSLSYVVHQGSSIRFFNCQTGNYCGEENLPEEFNYNRAVAQCKNCAISSEEVLLGDYNGNLFAKNLTKPQEKVVKLEKNHNDKILCTDSIYDDVMASGSGSIDPSVCLWKVESKKLLRKFEGIHKDSISSVLFLNLKNLLASASHSGSIIVSDYVQQNLMVIDTFNDHKDYVTDLGAHKSLLFSCSWDCSINVYDIKQMKRIKKIGNEELFDNFLQSLLIFDDNYFFTGDNYGNLYLFDMRKLDKEIYKKEIHERLIYRILKNDDYSIITGSDDRQLKCIDVTGGKELLKVKDKDGCCSGIFIFRNHFRKEQILPQFKELNPNQLKQLLKLRKIEDNKVYDNKYFKYSPNIDKYLEEMGKDDSKSEMFAKDFKERWKFLQQNQLWLKSEDQKEFFLKIKIRSNRKILSISKFFLIALKERDSKNIVFGLQNRNQEDRGENPNNNNMEEKKEKTVKEFLEELKLERFYESFSNDGIVYLSELECVEDPEELKDYFPIKFLRAKFFKHLRKCFEDEEIELVC